MFIKSSSAPGIQNNSLNRRDSNGTPTPGALSVNRPEAAIKPEASVAPSSANTTANLAVATPQQDQSIEKEKGARLIVGPDVKLKGAEILDCDMLVVEGRVEATMDSRVIRIADKGAFSGKVSIDVAEIHGSFDGELTARSQLVIHATGRVSGKIRYGKLVIAEGGELCGDINALSAERSSPPILNALSA
ncbi:polymer-forming cytoskeletal protein [Azonexus sp.]|uniref:bactofilin family protein n=1 Tax=Azonexus sp. TaxID=1872668 RepID=UPI0035B1A5D8